MVMPAIQWGVTRGGGPSPPEMVEEYMFGAGLAVPGNHTLNFSASHAEGDLIVLVTCGESAGRFLYQTGWSSAGSVGNLNVDYRVLGAGEAPGDFTVTSPSSLHVIVGAAWLLRGVSTVNADVDEDPFKPINTLASLSGTLENPTICLGFNAAANTSSGYPSVNLSQYATMQTSASYSSSQSAANAGSEVVTNGSSPNLRGSSSTYKVSTALIGVH